MSRIKCCVPMCPVTSKDDVYLHNFPNPVRDSERFRIWVSNIGGEILGLDNDKIFKNRKVCHRHFANNFIFLSHRLCKYAVPQLNLPAPHKTNTIINKEFLISEDTPVVSALDSNVKQTPSASHATLPDKKDVKTGTTICPEMNLAQVKKAGQRIVWVDLEMTGLDIDKDHILEIACIVTDADLNVVASGPNIVINQSDEILKNMNEWCIVQHGESGLTEASRKSKISLNAAEEQILEFVKTHAPEKKCPLGGNSVYMDRLFLRKYMPSLNNYLHYRIIDVSTIKELARRWYQKEFSNIPQKKFRHRSIDDIMESIEELKYFKSNIFKSTA